MKGHVYIFRQTGTDFYKIGMTTQSDVKHRFAAFKCYSPTGSEIVAVIPTRDARALEKKLHLMYANNRLQNEFFRLSESEIESICGSYRNAGVDDIINRVRIWLSNEKNDPTELIRFLEPRQPNEVTSDPVVFKDIVIEMFGGRMVTATEVHSATKENFNMPPNVIGRYLKNFFKKEMKRLPGDKNGKYVYIIPRSNEVTLE